MLPSRCNSVQEIIDVDNVVYRQSLEALVILELPHSYWLPPHCRQYYSVRGCLGRLPFLTTYHIV
jgi:hypothetical protein